MPRPPEPQTALTLPCPWRRLRYNLECIGWSQSFLATRAQLDDSVVRRMCRGDHAIPDDLAKWVEQLAAIHRALWQPPVWVPRGKAGRTSNWPTEDPDDNEYAEPVSLTPRELLQKVDRLSQDGVDSETG